MVFQNYALFPHMTVFANTAFPLKMRRWPKDHIASAVRDDLGIARLEGFAERSPRELSGGQQQRVALSRALVYRPPVLLMDEPLGALDKKLREELQIEIKHIQSQLALTVIYVTHDQSEALTMSDRIAVMYLGKVVEVGNAQEVMDAPRRPYTIALLDTIPKIHRSPKESHIRPLTGEAPNAAHIPSGCRFHPRCPLAFDRCRDEEPPLFEVVPGHVSACWLATDLGSQPKRRLAS